MVVVGGGEGERLSVQFSRLVDSSYSEYIRGEEGKARYSRFKKFFLMRVEASGNDTSRQIISDHII